MGGALRASTVDSIRAVDPAEWSRLAEGGGLAVGHPYLLSVEADAQVPATYVLVHDAGGRLAGALPCYHWSGAGDNLQYYHPHAVLMPDDLRQASSADAWLPMRLLGTRSAYWNEFLVHPAWRGAGRRRVIGELLAAALGAAADRPTAAWGLMYLTAEAAADVLPLLPPETALLLTTADTRLDIAWDGFDGYLAQLSSRRRASVRAEAARFAAAGFDVSTCRLGDCWERVGPLFGNLQRKYGVEMTDAQATAYLGAQAEALDRHSLVFLCASGGRPVAFTLFYRWGRRMYARLAGMDYAATEGTAAYFNLCYYLPIRRAIEERAESIWWGPASWESKVLRGARLEPRWSAVTPPPDLADRWRPAVSRWNEGFRQGWTDYTGPLGAAPTGPGWSVEALREVAR